MRFSLIVATVGRTPELERLFQSLERQTFRDFEVVVVDQNSDDRLLTIIDAFAHGFTIRRLTCAPGLSHARNLGLHEAQGDIVAFPDDDCWYPDGVLAFVDEMLKDHPEWDGVLGDAVDDLGKLILPWPDHTGRLTAAMCWRRAVTFAYFLRRDVLGQIGGFDESMGPGSGTPWASGEDNDLVLRTLEAGCYVQYDPAIRVHHPRLFLSFDEMGREKRYKYALGDGHLLRKHPMPLWWKILFFAVPVCRAILALVTLDGAKTRFHWVTVSGRLSGYFSAS